MRDIIFNGYKLKKFQQYQNMNTEVEFFKHEEKKLVVLRKIQGEDRVVDFDASII